MIMCHTASKREWIRSTKMCVPELSKIHKMFLLVVWLLAELYINLIPHCAGIELSPCRNKVTEISGTWTTSITCSGLDRTLLVSWFVEYDNGARATIGDCGSVTSPAASSSCTEGSVTGLFDATRPSPTISVMTITPSSLRNGADYIRGSTLRCSQLPSALTVCRMDYVYGPSNVAITGTSPFDTNGSQTLVLTCSVPGSSNPAPTFQWTRPPRPDVIHRARTYTFQPRVSDDGVQLSCTASNTSTSASDTDTFFVDLNYPPTTDPAITVNSIESHLYQGDSVTLTCGVEGGKPVSATTLTFTCPGKDDGPDITGSTMVSSKVTFTSLTSDDHDDMCTCRTKWKVTDWYSKTSTRKLFVNSPPSVPTIQASFSVSEYPFIATVTPSATLTCDSSTPGHPAATYTWPVNHGGRVGTDVRGRGTLTFDTISKEHDGKAVSCRAGNRYTANRLPVPDGNLTLEVYYHPEVHIVPVTDTNQCQPLTSDPSHCLVIEGQSVHFRCQATSKPVAKVFTWQPGSGNSSELYIQSANPDLHNRTYSCSVETGLGNHGNDPRLPLRNSSLLTVFVESIMKSSGGKKDSTLGVGAAVGVSVAVMVFIVVVFFVVFFVWLWRRHWVLPCAAAIEREADVTLESRNVAPPRRIEHHGQGQSDDYEIQNIDNTTPSEYASPRTDEIGLRSVYSKITPTYINTGTAAEPGPVYENTDVLSRSPYVNASDYKG